MKTRICPITGKEIPFAGDSRRVILLTLYGVQLQVTVAPDAEIWPNITKLWKKMLSGWLVEDGSKNSWAYKAYNDPPIGILADQTWAEVGNNSRWQ